MQEQQAGERSTGRERERDRGQRWTERERSRHESTDVHTSTSRRSRGEREQGQTTWIVALEPQAAGLLFVSWACAQVKAARAQKKRTCLVEWHSATCAAAENMMLKT